MKRRLIRLAIVVAALFVVLAVPAASEEICHFTLFCHVSACQYDTGVAYEIEICYYPPTGEIRQTITFLGCRC